MSYSQIVGSLNTDKDDPVVWKFNKIIGYQGPLDNIHKNYKGSFLALVARVRPCPELCWSLIFVLQPLSPTVAFHHNLSAVLFALSPPGTVGLIVAQCN